ncbi:site-specific integrase [Aureimonas psammosilenae]|uniref:site-specific integrase n=1 Tax=Aureimonas psammosilenae TaxID=2495496 RepID=UPI00186A5E86|nr:site-specific integrase [Aureimonas psammosilenae]
MKRSASTFHQFIQRIPADVIGIARGRTLNLPVGQETIRVALSAKALDVRCSLRTRDPGEAKARQAAVTAYLERAWRAMRAKPVVLSQKEITALAGLLYQDLTAKMEDEPGEVGIWQAVIDRFQHEREAGTLETWFGSTVDELLLSEGLNVAGESRTRLLEAGASALVDAAGRLGRNAEGDYAPDPKANRFPQWAPKKAATAPKPVPSGKGSTVQSLLTKLAAERAYAPKTVSEWTRSISSLTDHASTVVPSEITPDHIIAWTDALVEKGLSAKTINETYLAAVKALFRWAKAKRQIAYNPALDVPKVARRDEGGDKRGFTLAEAQTILTAATSETTPLRRWVPWLLAHTGARAGEVVQLRRQDVRQDPETGIWLIDISPSAGRLKNKASARVVPLHRQLVDMGFPTWVAGQKRERLFYEERPGEAEDGKRSRKSVAINRLGDWVRALELTGVLSGEVSPNHGWRHRISVELTNHEVIETVRRRITGHTLDGQDNRYVGKLALERMREAVDRLPAYDVSAGSETL